MYSYKTGVSQHLKELIQDCIAKCDEVNIPISKNITFDVMKGDRTYGVCSSCRSVDAHLIRINKNLVNEQEIINTIFHELLHSCKNCHGHGAQWRYYGSVILKYYGHHISRCDNKTVTTDVRTSRRKYYTKDEYLANKDILVALTTEGNTAPMWYVKKNSAIMRRVLKGVSNSRGKKIVIFKEVK